MKYQSPAFRIARERASETQTDQFVVNNPGIGFVCTAGRPTVQKRFWQISPSGEIEEVK